jgi:hypothetical protein
MTWADYIHADPAVLGGKPVIRGTRLAVAFRKTGDARALRPCLGWSAVLGGQRSSRHPGLAALLLREA